MSIHSEIKLNNILLPYNSGTGASLSGILEGCQSVNLSAELYQPVRFEMDTVDCKLNDSWEINGIKATAIFATDTNYQSIPGVGIVALSSTLPGAAPVRFSPLEYGSVTTQLYTVAFADWDENLPPGDTMSLGFGTQRALWYISKPDDKTINAQPASFLGYGDATALSDGDILKIVQTANQISFYINDSKVYQVPLMVQFTVPAGLGTLASGTPYIPTGTNRAFATKSISSGINTGNIGLLCNDGTAATLNTIIEKFEILSPTSPLGILPNNIVNLTASTPANWISSAVGGVFTPSPTNQSSVAYNTTGLVPGIYTLTADCNCNTGQTDTIQISIVEVKANGNVLNLANCFKTQRNLTTQFALNFGVGPFQWSASHGIISNTGLYLSPNRSDSDTVTVTDLATGQTITILICVEIPMAICVTEKNEIIIENLDNCCNDQLSCGETKTYEVPSASFNALAIGQNNQPPDWSVNTLMSATGSYGQITSNAVNAGAVGQKLPQGVDGSYTQTIHPTALSVSGIHILAGFATGNAGGVLANIAYGLGVDATGKVVIYQSGVIVVLPGFATPAVAGHTLTIARVGNEIRYYYDSTLLHTTIDNTCGDLYVNVQTNKANVVFAGVAQAVWSILTAGTAAEVGTVNVNGTYTAPQNSNLLEVLLQASVNGVFYYKHIELIEEISSYQDPSEFVTGEIIEAYFSADPIPVGQSPRIGRNGFLDRLANPRAMAVGETKDGFEFKEDNNWKKLDGSRGTVAISRSKPTAMLEFTMLGHRNPNRLKHAFPHLNVQQVSGATQVSAGSNYCECPGSFVVIKPSKTCAGKYDALVIHRYVSMSDFEMSMKPEELIEHKVKLTGLIDSRRPSKERIWSIYYALDCGGNDPCD